MVTQLKIKEKKMAYKFKIGDKVKMLVDDSFGSLTYKGQIGTIVADIDSDEPLVSFEGRRGGEYWIEEKDMELASKLSKSYENTVWERISTTPPEGVALLTKISDEFGERNLQTLIKQGNLWWTTDKSMYVYYQPTHWAYV